MDGCMDVFVHVMKTYRGSRGIKLQCKEVKTQLFDYLLMLLLIERHVSAYSEATIRFNNCQL